MVKKRGLWIFIFLLPTIFLFTLVFASSVLLVFGSSFTNWRLVGDVKFVGLENYIELFTNDRSFYKAFQNTAIWVALQSTVHVIIGLVFALILAKKEFYWKFARTVYMIPIIISGAALGIIYVQIFNPRFGVVNELIRFMGVEGFQHNWFFSFETAFITVTLTRLPYAGIITILILAQIASLPSSVLEAAKIDGAGEFKRNIYVVLPMLRHILGTSVILGGTSMLKDFEIIYITTRGGPGVETLNLPLYLYRVAMSENNYGYANTVGVFLMLLGIAFIIIVNKSFRMNYSDT